LKPETGSTGINLAVCGATSVSYRAQGYWSDVLRNIEKDASAYRTIVTIAFGHNDQKYKLTNVMTLNHLKEFVGDVRAAATPVLVTPLSRTNINPDGTMKRTLLFEAAITREAGVQTDTVVLDLTKASHQQFLADGYERVLTYRRSPGDTTHLTLVGAQVIGGVVCRLFQDGLPDLAGYVEC
jgi:lysophospholipase L1-like esterase